MEFKLECCGKEISINMKRILFVLYFLVSFSLMAQQRQLLVSFYNQENFFDTIDDPHKNDNEFLPTAKNNWNTEKYLNKVNHMASVVAAIHPDVMGMCEVENRAVLEDLVKDSQIVSNNYQIVHVESPDERSIDNALIFKPSVLTLLSYTVYPVKIDSAPHFKTRDILVARFKLSTSIQVVFLVNHFPSRLGGQEKSEHKRFAAAAVLRHIFDSIQLHSPTTRVIAMGDFNDEPTNRSIDSVLKAGGNDADLYNAMLPLKLQGQGSLKYRNEWNMLDQIIMSKNCKSKSPMFAYADSSALVFKQTWMEETEEKYKGSPKRTFAGQRYLNGYSDHFPVTATFNYVLIEPVKINPPGKRTPTPKRK